MKKFNWAQKCLLTNLDMYAIVYSEDIIERLRKFVIKHPKISVTLVTISIPVDIVVAMFKGVGNLVSSTVGAIINFDESDYTCEEEA